MINVPEFLTLSEIKRKVYAGDPYFREAWEDVLLAWGKPEDIQATLWGFSAIIFRPDSLVVRGVTNALELLSSVGFVPVAVRTFSFERLAIRELWRYQLNVATRERIDVMDMVLSAGPSLYVVLKDTEPHTDFPSTVRLRHYKGPTNPLKRHPQHLRYSMGQAQASALSYIHVADEPADFVREMGVLFPVDVRFEILASMEVGTDCSPEIKSQVTELERREAPHTLDFSASISALRKMLAQSDAPRTDRLDVIEAMAQLDAICSGRSRDWRSLFTHLRKVGCEINKWDQIAVAAHLCSNYTQGDDYNEAEALIPDAKSDSWIINVG